MGWATHYITQLQAGATVQCRPRGNSMTPKIKSGQLCTIVPTAESTIEKGDVVLCKVNGKQYLHLVTAINGSRYQISNNHGHVNGWVTQEQVFGKCVEVQS